MFNPGGWGENRECTPATRGAGSRRRRTSSVSAVFHYLGPAFAVLLFARVAPLGVAWLRIASAAVVFAVWRRPWRPLRAADRSTVWLVVALGGVLAVMNSCFYEAIARLPLGTVSAIEFLPVIVLAAVGVALGPQRVRARARGGRGVQPGLGAGTPVSRSDSRSRSRNAALFVLYIVLAHRGRACRGAPASTDWAPRCWSRRR